MFLSILHIIGLFLTIMSGNEISNSFCDIYRAAHTNVEQKKEARVVLDVCKADITNFEGTFLIVEDKYIPIPKEFFFFSDPGQFIISMTSTDSTINDEDWPYTTAHLVSSNQSLERLNYANTIVRELPSPVKSSECGLYAQLKSYSIPLSEGGFVFTASEAKFGEHTLVIFGNSTDLLLGIMDSYVRINCEEN